MIGDTESRAIVKVVGATDVRYPRHHRSEVDVDIDAHRLFAYLDDHKRLAGHMEKPSLMMAGATMRVETDTLRGQAVGSVIRVTGRVLGLNLAVEEMVTERVPPLRKIWETCGEPRLLVIGSYRMGLTISPRKVIRDWWCSSTTGFRRAVSPIVSRLSLVTPMRHGALGA